MKDVERFIADREFARFERVAEPTPDGLGWYDPTQEPVPVGGYVPHPSERPPGVPRGWTARSWIRHLKYMSNACGVLPALKFGYVNAVDPARIHQNAERLGGLLQCLIRSCLKRQT